MATRKKFIYEKMNAILHVFRFIGKDVDSTAFIDDLFKLGREYCERHNYNVIGEHIDETPYYIYRQPKYDEIRRGYEDVKPLTIMSCGFNPFSLGLVTYGSRADEIEIRKNNPVKTVARLFDIP
jgi:hypothetical protein